MWFSEYVYPPGFRSNQPKNNYLGRASSDLVENNLYDFTEWAVTRRRWIYSCFTICCLLFRNTTFVYKRWHRLIRKSPVVLRFFCPIVIMLLFRPGLDPYLWPQTSTLPCHVNRHFTQYTNPPESCIYWFSSNYDLKVTSDFKIIWTFCRLPEAAGATDKILRTTEKSGYILRICEHSPISCKWIVFMTSLSSNFKLLKLLLSIVLFLNHCYTSRVAGSEVWGLEKVVMSSAAILLVLIVWKHSELHYIQLIN